MTRWETHINIDTDEEVECCVTTFKDSNVEVMLSVWEDGTEFTFTMPTDEMPF